jgi:GTP-binding protein Era
MLVAALEALAEADVVVLVVDPTEAPTPQDEERLSSALTDVSAPLLVALNKSDSVPGGSMEVWTSWVRARFPRALAWRISAEGGDGVDDLIAGVAQALPEGPFLYPEDEIASNPVRFFVAELVRETIFEQYHQEIPYSVFCEVAEFREDQDPVYIHIDVHVERKSQKGILIGKNGAAIRELGSAARAKIEHFLGERVYLDLWVKPLESWRKSRAHLGRFGFRLPAENERSR